MGVGSYFDPKLKLNGIKLNISSWRRPAPNTIPWDTKAAGLYMICTLSKHEAEAKGFTDLDVRSRREYCRGYWSKHIFLKINLENFILQSRFILRWNNKKRSY